MPLLEAVKGALRIDGDEFDAQLSRNIQAATERAARQAPDAPDATRHEAVILFVAHLFESPSGADNVSQAGIWRRCGAEGLLSPWTIRRRGIVA